MKTDKDENWIEKLDKVIKKLRGPDGCPWDREQTHKTLKKHLMEECAELLDALEDDESEAIREELGDVLMHIVLHSAIAEENGRFNLDEVARESTEKMIRRHPHVFGNESVNNAGEVVDLWERVKRKEKSNKKPSSALHGVPAHMPSILKAEKIQKKAAKFGFDWNTEEQILEKIEEELNELKEACGKGNQKEIDEEIGDLLFAVSNLSRFRKKSSGEELLAAATAKFIKRFSYIENKIKHNGEDLRNMTLDELEILWQKAKKETA